MAKLTEIDGYQIDILVQGYPGKTVCHGGLGWSTLVLIRGHGRVALVDTGGFGVRKVLIDPHAHHDHCISWVLFPKARIVIGANELAWAVREPWGETPVPELYVRELKTWPTVHEAADGEELMPAITAHLAAGHTPGHLVYVLRGRERDVIFCGDAAKNRAELLTGKADMSYDPAITAASIATIWTFWRRRPGNIVVPGHDIPMVQKDGVPEYLVKREAAIK